MSKHNMEDEYERFTNDKTKYLNLSKKQISLNDIDIKQLIERDFRELNTDLHNLICLELSSNQISSLTANIFSSLKSLKWLALDSNAIKRLSAYTFIGLENLETLGLSKNQINEIDETAFNGLTKLKELFLNENKIETLNPEKFNCLANLKKLKFYSNKINEIKDKAFLGLSKLEHLDLSKNQLTKLKENAFDGLEQLQELRIRENKLHELEDNIFQSLKELIILYLDSNDLVKLNENTFNGMINLQELWLNDNKIETIDNKSFDNLKSLTMLQLKNNKITSLTKEIFQNLTKLQKLILSSNEISVLDSKTFNKLKSLKELHIENNELASLEEEIFTGLNLDILYLHFINFDLNSKVFTKMSNTTQLTNLTLFDEFILYKPNFKNSSELISQDNLSLYFGRTLANHKLNTEFFLSSNSLVSFKLNQEYKIIQKDFEWKNISKNLSVITGYNGVGKTTFLQLIKESLNQEENLELTDYCVVKYFHTAETKFTMNQNELHNFNKRLNTIDYLKNKIDWSGFLYDSINYFDLIQYFDYLVHINVKFDEFIILNSKLFKYKFDEKKCQQRKNQQNRFQQKKHNNYYDGMRSIEFYLGLDEENHKLSPGESLILLLELWRIHAEYLKQENQTRPFRTKLRIVLLDEPDCHMHPSLIKEFIRLLTNNDLNYLKFQVIMSTHNPVCISFIPLENIFEMKRDQQSSQIIIDKISNKSELIRDVSEDLIFIKEKFKIVFIEGGGRGEDEAFYSLVNLIVNKDIYIPIKFQEMGNCQFNQIFIKDVNQNSSYKIDEFIFGINDGDFNIPNAYRFFRLKNKYTESKTENEKFQNNFKRLERYSFENYVYDPINFFFAINHLIKKNLVVLKENQVVSDYINNVKVFLKEIESYQNINDFIKADIEKAKLILNKLLKDTSDFFLEKVSRDSQFFEVFNLKNLPNDDALKQKIRTTFILSDNSLFTLDYYPILLFFPGKELRALIFKEIQSKIIFKTRSAIKELINIFKDESGFLVDKSLFSIFKNICK
jgi:Leucine-rich repeat (LRR) protein